MSKAVYYEHVPVKRSQVQKNRICLSASISASVSECVSECVPKCEFASVTASVSECASEYVSVSVDAADNPDDQLTGQLVAV